MSLNEVDPAANRSTANGVATVFPYTFKIDAESELEVLVNTTVQALTTEYTVDGVGNSGGGNVTFVTAPANGTTVTRLRKQPGQQLSTYLANESFPHARVEGDFDKVWKAIQQIREQLYRSILLPKSAADGNLTFPAVTTRANKYLTFNSSGVPTATDAATASGTSVTATGSTTARLLADRFAEVVNLKDFGAIGNGVADDTVAIQAALDYAAAGQVKKVFAPSGKYLISQIAIPSGVELGGAWTSPLYGSSGSALTDLGTMFVQQSSFNDDAIVFNGRTASGFYRVENVYLHDFILTKTGSSDTAGNGISARQVGLDRTVTANHSLVNAMCIFNRLLIRGFPENGMYFKQGAAALHGVQDIYTLFCGGYGIKYEGLNYSDNLLIRNVTGDGNKGGAAIYVAVNTGYCQVAIDGVYAEYRSDNPYGNTGAFGGASPYAVVIGDSTDTCRFHIANTMVSSIVSATAAEAAIFIDCPTEAETPAVTFTNCINRTIGLAGGSKKTLIDKRTAWGTQVTIPENITTGTYTADTSAELPVSQHMGSYFNVGHSYLRPSVGDEGVVIGGGTPVASWYEDDAPSDEKSWFCGPSAGDFFWRTQTDAAGSPDIFFKFERTGNAVSAVTTTKAFQVETANIAECTMGHASELLTLSTSGTTTDTSANLLPAGAQIISVTARVTTTITTATDWKLGDATTAGRFCTAQTGLTSGTTVVGQVHADQTGAAGPIQTSAAKVRVTTTGTPGAGAIRITVFYLQTTAPTS